MVRTRTEAFNEWMRRYIKEPERFKREWQAVGDCLASVGAGKAPSYGERCSALMEKLEAGD